MKTAIEIEQQLAKVLGWNNLRLNKDGRLIGRPPDDPVYDCSFVPKWATNDGASRSLEVKYEVNVRWLDKKIYAFHLGNFGRIEVYFKDHGNCKRRALRVAIALAAIDFLRGSGNANKIPT